MYRSHAALRYRMDALCGLRSTWIKEWTISWWWTMRVPQQQRNCFLLAIVILVTDQLICASSNISHQPYHVFFFLISGTRACQAEHNKAKPDATFVVPVLQTSVSFDVVPICNSGSRKEAPCFLHITLFPKYSVSMYKKHTVHARAHCQLCLAQSMVETFYQRQVLSSWTNPWTKYEYGLAVLSWAGEHIHLQL